MVSPGEPTGSSLLAERQQPSGYVIRDGLVLADARSQPRRLDVLVEADRITAVGSNLQSPPGVDVLDASDRLVIPGLVNAHTHAHNHLSKGAIDGLPLEIWIQYLAARVMGRTAREVYVGAAIGAIEMAKTGCTCACEMAQILPWPTDDTLDAVAQAYADVGLRAAINVQVADLPLTAAILGLADALPADVLTELQRAPAYPRDDVLATVTRAVDRWHGAGGGRLRFGIGPNLATICSDELLRGCVELSRERDLTLQMHLSETKAEAVTARERFGKSAGARLMEIGALGPRTLLAHCVWIDHEEIRLIAETGSSVAHNPVSNLKLGAGIAPVREMRQQGCNVAIGTDGSASSDNQNVFGPLRLAAILQRVRGQDFETWPVASDVLEMATANGARAAGFEGQVGTIAPGRKADLVLLDLRSSYFHPANDLVSQLVHCEVGSSVRTVLVDGRAIVRDGRMATVDESALLAEADEIGERIAHEMEGRGARVRHLEPAIRQATDAANRAPWPIDRYA